MQCQPDCGRTVSQTDIDRKESHYHSSSARNGDQGPTMQQQIQQQRQQLQQVQQVLHQQLENLEQQLRSGQGGEQARQQLAQLQAQLQQLAVQQQQLQQMHQLMQQQEHQQQQQQQEQEQAHRSRRRGTGRTLRDLSRLLASFLEDGYMIRRLAPALEYEATALAAYTASRERALAEQGEYVRRLEEYRRGLQGSATEETETEGHSPASSQAKPASPYGRGTPPLYPMAPGRLASNRPPTIHAQLLSCSDSPNTSPLVKTPAGMFNGARHHFILKHESAAGVGAGNAAGSTCGGSNASSNMFWLNPDRFLCDQLAGHLRSDVDSMMENSSPSCSQIDDNGQTQRQPMPPTPPPPVPRQLPSIPPTLALMIPSALAMAQALSGADGTSEAERLIQAHPLRWVPFFDAERDLGPAETRQAVHPSLLGLFAEQPPAISLADFYARLLERMGCPLECFLYALCLMHRVSRRAGTMDTRPVEPLPAIVEVIKAQEAGGAALRRTEAPSGAIPPLMLKHYALPEDIDGPSPHYPHDPTPPGTIPVTTRSVHRLLLTALVISIKMRCDSYHGLSYYADVGGVARSDLVMMERTLLRLLGYNPHVSADLFCDVVYSLRYHCADLLHNKKQHWVETIWAQILNWIPIPPPHAVHRELIGTLEQLLALRRNDEKHKEHSNLLSSSYNNSNNNIINDSNNNTNSNNNKCNNHDDNDHSSSHKSNKDNAVRVSQP